MRLVALVSLLALGGCATLVMGSSQDVSVITDPPGAACQINQDGASVGYIFSTPGTVRLGKSKHDISVSCTKTGYAQTSVINDSHMIGATFGNVIVLGGFVGLAVDASTGANFLYRGEMHIGLDPAPGAAVPVMSQLHCPAKGMQAGRTNGTAPIYDDVDPSVPDACAEHDAIGTKRSLCFALAPASGPDGSGACQALKAVLRGPAGATGSYQTTTDRGTWSVKVELAPPDILLIEDQKIRAIRLVEFKSNPASGVEGQVTTWIDPVTGMPLKRTWTQTKGSKVDEPEWEVIKITAT